MRAKRIAVLAAVLVVGIGIGAAAGGSSTKTASTKATTVTNTVTVPHTTTVTVPHKTTVTKAVTKNSAACVTDVKNAQKVLTLTREAFTVVGEYPSLVSQAAQAGADMDANALNQVTVKIKAINATISNLAGEIKKIPALKPCN